MAVQIKTRSIQKKHDKQIHMHVNETHNPKMVKKKKEKRKGHLKCKQILSIPYDNLKW